MVRLIVNGRSKFIGFNHLSFEQIVVIAGDGIAPTGSHTVSYVYRDGDLKKGELQPGQSMPVRNDMEIQVLETT